MHAAATAGLGFLFAVLWFDLMFDVQATRPKRGDLSRDVVVSISSYYRRVTTTARPMNRLVAVVMLTTLAAPPRFAVCGCLAFVQRAAATPRSRAPGGADLAI